jgi:hypothetical protein
VFFVEIGCVFLRFFRLVFSVFLMDCEVCGSVFVNSDFEFVFRCERCALDHYCTLCPRTRCKRVNMVQHVEMSAKHEQRVAAARRVAPAVHLAIGLAIDRQLGEVDPPVVELAVPVAPAVEPALLVAAPVVELVVPVVAPAVPVAAPVVEPRVVEFELRERELAFRERQVAVERDSLALDQARFDLEKARFELECRRREGERPRVKIEIEILDSPRVKIEIEDSPPRVKIEIEDSPPRAVVEADAELEVDQPAAPTAEVVASLPQEADAELVADQPAAPTACDRLAEQEAFVSRAKRLLELDSESSDSERERDLVRAKAMLAAKKGARASLASVRPPVTSPPRFLPWERIEREEGELGPLPEDLVDLINNRPPILALKPFHDLMNSLPKFLPPGP